MFSWLGRILEQRSSQPAAFLNALPPIRLESILVTLEQLPVQTLSPPFALLLFGLINKRHQLAAFGKDTEKVHDERNIVMPPAYILNLPLLNALLLHLNVSRNL
mmetsp:Transcript_22830/g.69873  ORF Transcript_22830/g.69873 Transcript_22830/m.69873 type:complete len:104 (+) Transcript_22830:73-384(+)